MVKVLNLKNTYLFFLYGALEKFSSHRELLNFSQTTLEFLLDNSWIFYFNLSVENSGGVWKKFRSCLKEIQDFTLTTEFLTSSKILKIESYFTFQSFYHMLLLCCTNKLRRDFKILHIFFFHAMEESNMDYFLRKMPCAILWCWFIVGGVHKVPVV